MENENKTEEQEKDGSQISWSEALKGALKRTVPLMVGLPLFFYGALYCKEHRIASRAVEHLGLTKYIEEVLPQAVTKDEGHRRNTNGIGIHNLISDIRNYHNGIASREGNFYKAKDGCVFQLEEVNHVQGGKIMIPIQGIPSQFYPYELIKTVKN